jgi:acetyl-CoA C-acetyltransferase
MTKQRHAVIAAARRTPVAPRGGALCHLQADELAAPVLSQLILDAGFRPDQVDHVILGNALYGGGNPARRAALRAGISPSVPAMTIDTQCCSGLDAILLGKTMIESGAATCVLAGGAESFSRAPVRMHRPLDPKGQPVAYDRPIFAPPPFGDPDLAEAAARLAADGKITREAQVDYAVNSHTKARASVEAMKRRLVKAHNVDLASDAFTRKLAHKTAMRAPVLTGNKETGLSAATIACEADGAAAVLMVAEHVLRDQCRSGLKILDGLSSGCDPAEPALGPIFNARVLLNRLNMSASDFACIELMEAYAVQAMVTVEALDLVPGQLNRLGGALSRGHPIGGSGAILAVQLFENMLQSNEECGNAQSFGMALIAAAGGLASGVVVEVTI